MFETLPPATLLTFVALAASAVALWLPLRFVWVTLCTIAVIAGYFAGVLSGPAIVPIVILAAACWGYPGQKTNPLFPGARLLFALVIVAVSLLLGFSTFPGFHYSVYVKDLVLSPGARPYTKALTFEVWIVGVLILGFCYQGFIRSGTALRSALQRAWPVIVVNAGILIPLALALGFVRFDPKWTSFFWLWAALQLCFTILTEEAFFRGFIQRELAESLGRHRFGPWAAIGVAAVTFGLAHFGGGTPLRPARDHRWRGLRPGVPTFRPHRDVDARALHGQLDAFSLLYLSLSRLRPAHFRHGVRLNPEVSPHFSSSPRTQRWLVQRAAASLATA